MSVPTIVDPKAVAPPEIAGLAPLDASKLTIIQSTSLKPIPASNDLVFGKHTTDHMLIAHFVPTTGWTDPQIIPYAPLVIDPAASCFQYCPSVFEGMKAYLGPDGRPRLFRPQLNMARMERSAARVALPPFDSSALLTLIQRLVALEHRWIPSFVGSSLYLRPTLIGTRPSLGVVASDYATLYVICSPTGPFFSVPRPLKLYAEHKHTRAWPGGTGEFKLGLNYAPAFAPQRVAALKGYDQVLWILDEGALLDGEEEAGKPERCRVTEAGAMNIFFVLSRADPSDPDLDVVTPRLDGTILPGVTRASVLSLTAAHPERTSLQGIPNHVRLRPVEQRVSMADVYAWAAEGRLKEVFCAGTAVIVAPVGALGFHGRDDLIVPAAKKSNGHANGHANGYGFAEQSSDGLGLVGSAMKKRILDIQEGKIAWEGWSVACE